MKKLFILSIILCVLGITKVIQAQEVKHLSTADFKKEIWDFSTNKDWKYLGDKPAIVDLYATWCPPCKKLSPILEQIQKDYGKKIQIYKVDVDQEPELESAFKIRTIPNLLLCPLNGKPTMKLGTMNKNQLKELIETSLLSE